MPKIYNDSKFTVYIYTNDHQPAHVHVFPGRKGNQPDMKITIGNEEQRPRLIKKDRSITNKDAIAALKLVAQHQQEFLSRWEDIHG